MKKYRVEFSPESDLDLDDLYEWIALESSYETAFQYTEDVREFCCDLSVAPHRATLRNEIRRGLRIIGFRRRVAIWFSVSDETQTVIIARILYAGRTDRKAQRA